MKHKREKSDDGQETVWAKHHCPEMKKLGKAVPNVSEEKAAPVSQKEVGPTEVMEFPTISTGKCVTMAANDFQSFMDFVRYV